MNHFLYQTHRKAAAGSIRAARRWRTVAVQAMRSGDSNRAAFAHYRAVLCELYATEDKQKANEQKVEVFA